VSDFAIEFDGVWKRFRRGERQDSLRDLITLLGRKLLQRGRETALRPAEFWALEDVSFAVRRGEALGIIGPNGAGKSTTLKLLYRILRPTRGRIRTTGRVGGLIEIAAGFHPDLTGRENIYLQGAIYGLRTREIAKRFDQIVEFAGVEEFIDTPVKRYSSGMHARLGFSVAANLDPDVLLIDEVLAVGDAAFQARCVERMKSFKRQGTAILFVSHNMQAVSDLCDRVIFLRHSIQHEGAPSEAISKYLLWSRGDGQRGSGDSLIIGPAKLVDSSGAPIDSVGAGQRLSLEAQYEVRLPMKEVVFGVSAYRSTDGLLVYAEDFTCAQLGLNGLQPGYRFSIHYNLTSNLVGGQYHLELYAYDKLTTEHIATLAPAAPLRVHETRTVTGVADLRIHATASNGTQ
jgi:lipopolysaccharide transport system ATP-binding protein